MTCSSGDTYVGLTDDPNRRKEEHNNPADWRIVREFTSETEARLWETVELSRPGHCGGGGGWRYGYKYTVTASTQE